MEAFLTASRAFLPNTDLPLKELLVPYLRTQYHLSLEARCELSSKLFGSGESSLVVVEWLVLLSRHWEALVKEVGTPHPATQFDLVLYHGGCPDGTAAAWCFWRHNRALEYRGMKHGVVPPDVTGRRVAIVDFSFPRAQLEQMKAQAASLRVWDHHETARDDLAGLDYCTFDMKQSGCELAWRALEGSKPLPYFLQAIGDHDVWREVEPSEAITRALREQRGNSFENYDQLLANPKREAELLVEGRKLLAQDEAAIARALKYAKLYRLKGTEYVVRAGVPPTNLRSEFGHAMCKQGGCDFSLSYIYSLEDGEFWLSLRSMDHLPSVAEVASKYFPKGGGHRNAAGATLYERAKGQTLSQYLEPCVAPVAPAQ